MIVHRLELIICILMLLSVSPNALMDIKLVETSVSQLHFAIRPVTNVKVIMTRINVFHAQVQTHLLFHTATWIQLQKVHAPYHHPTTLNFF